MAQSRMGRAKSSQRIVQKSIGDTHFLGIGINAYTHWPALHNAVRDVEAIAALLVDTYGISSTTLLLNEDASRKNILAELERLANNLKTPDSLIIYYAGHGHLNNRKRGFWVPFDATEEGIDQYIANSTIRDYIGDIPSLHTLLISDACFSGSLFVRGKERASNLKWSELAHLPSRWAICSGRHDEVVADGPEEEHSPFAQSILDVLSKSDRDAITTNFLYEQVRLQTRSNYTQLPDGGPLQNVGHKRGEYVFVQTLGEQNIWEHAHASETIAAYQSYLDAFPEGQHIAAARQQITKLAADEAWHGIQHLSEETLAEINAKLFRILGFCQQYPNSTHYAAAVALGKQLDSKKEFISNYHSLFGLMEIANKPGPFQEAAQQQFVALQADLQKENIPQPTPPRVATTATSKKGGKPAARPKARNSATNTKKNKPQQTQPAPPSAYDVYTEIANNLVRVAGGTFTMGCKEGRDTDCYVWEKPAHKVNVPTFYLSKYLVTQAQWRAVMGSDPEELFNKGCDQCPVEGVSWRDTQRFLQILNASSGANYRLPTEAEWEYAARGGQQSRGYRYSGSDDLDEVAWYNKNATDGNTNGAEKTTRPVGEKKANELGLYDLNGNVSEWCADDWHDNYKGAPEDGSAWQSGGTNASLLNFFPMSIFEKGGANTSRVVRSGSWSSSDSGCRVSGRYCVGNLDYRSSNTGIRLARY